MLNLAAFRYRNVLVSQGGPIKRIEMADVAILGERFFLANAFLREGLAGKAAGQTLFSRANGSGVARSPMVARFMAISESLERWAHWQLYAHGAYGFDTDPSSNGMAAFPGLFKHQARAYALWEATERFNLLNWWEGGLPGMESPTRWPTVKAVTICSDAPGLAVILFRRTPAGFYAYGHAAGRDFDHACSRAAMEMERHALLVEHFALAHAGRIRDELPAAAHPIERRSLFFASAEGHELFRERICSGMTKPPAVPRLVYDGAVPGPWSGYADVWRVLYAPPSDRFLGWEENYFML